MGATNSVRSIRADRFRVRKLFDDLPCCHRSWRYEGRCEFLHGYERSFVLDFSCEELDAETGFVVDFAGLKGIRALLQGQFDHTLLIAEDDPALDSFKQLHDAGVCDLRVMGDTSMEGGAVWVWEAVSRELREMTNGRVRLAAVEARESRKNSVTLLP